jgi:hypothetical protein
MPPPLAPMSRVYSPDHRPWRHLVVALCHRPVAREGTEKVGPLVMELAAFSKTVIPGQGGTILAALWVVRIRLSCRFCIFDRDMPAVPRLVADTQHRQSSAPC